MKKQIARILSLAMILGMMTVGSLAAGAYEARTITGTSESGETLTLTFDAAKQEVRTLIFFTGFETSPLEWTECTLLTLKPGSKVTVTGSATDALTGYTMFEGGFNEIYPDRFSPVSGSVDKLFEFVDEDFGQMILLGLDNTYFALEGSPTTPYLSSQGEQVDQWAVELVNQAIDAKLMPQHLNYNDLTQSITRTQFAALTVSLYQAMSGQTAPVPQDNPFTDTNDQAVLSAYALGFTSGVAADRFGADEPLTREAAATMLCAVYKKLGGEIASDSASAFADDGSISSWAKTNVYFMAQNNIISGVGNNTFDPSSMAQSQAALIMALRMFQNLK